MNVTWTAPSVSGITGYEIFYTPTPAPCARLRRYSRRHRFGDDHLDLHPGRISGRLRGEHEDRRRELPTIYNKLAATPAHGGTLTLTPSQPQRFRLSHGEGVSLRFRQRDAVSRHCGS